MYYSARERVPPAYSKALYIYIEVTIVQLGHFAQLYIPVDMYMLGGFETLKLIYYCDSRDNVDSCYTHLKRLLDLAGGVVNIKRWQVDTLYGHRNSKVNCLSWPLFTFFDF